MIERSSHKRKVDGLIPSTGTKLRIVRGWCNGNISAFDSVRLQVRPLLPDPNLMLLELVWS